jgi:formylmethanofuran:tetrahydromethanopterin formyltransferase
MAAVKAGGKVAAAAAERCVEAVAAVMDVVASRTVVAASRAARNFRRHRPSLKHNRNHKYKPLSLHHKRSGLKVIVALVGQVIAAAK